MVGQLAGLLDGVRVVDRAGEDVLKAVPVDLVADLVRKLLPVDLVDRLVRKLLPLDACARNGPVGGGGHH
ncbi:hypothetical protein E4U41_005166 [Claviceps citrina]|nr:hypothetical protein E4U41_005166 [Claviceps citrina]